LGFPRKATGVVHLLSISASALDRLATVDLPSHL
jgi:hypothetical protein